MDEQNLTSTNETTSDWDSVDFGDISLADDSDADNKDVEYRDTVTEDNSADQPEESTEPKEDIVTETSAEATPETNQSFKLKHLGEEVEVTQEEAVTLAQKGLDYDRVKVKYEEVKGKHEELKGFKEKYSEAAELVDELAKEQNMTLEQFADEVRIGKLVQQGMDRGVAEVRVAAERDKSKLVKENEALKAEASTKTKAGEDAQKAEARRKADVQEFIESRPDIKPEDVPKEVWAEVAKGKSLLAAFTTYENAKLKVENEALKQNQKNKSTSVNSQTSVGSPTKVDPLVADWYKN